MATCSLLIRSWSKEPCSYYFVAPKKLSLIRKAAKSSAYCDHDASFLPRMYMDQSPRNLTGQSPRRIFERWNTFWSQPPPGTNSSRKKNDRQQKNPKKKKSTSRMKTISNYVPALRTMQQDKTVANQNPPKTKQHIQHEENCYKVDGYKSNHCRKHCSRIHSVSKFVLTTAVDKCTRQ